MGLTRPRAHQLQDIDYKQTARAVTTSNITLSGGAPATVDGVSLALRDRILVTGQSTGSENGIYYVTTVGAGSNGTWARSLDADTTGEVSAGMIIMVTEGTTYADTQWKLTTDDPITIGSTSLTFVRNGNAAYGTVAVSGEDSIVADSIGDTLTVASGNNISLTTNASTDTLTVAVSDTITTTGNVTGGNLIATSGLSLGGTAVTSTATELNLLDGVTGLTLGTANEILIVGSDNTSIEGTDILTIDTASNYVGINQTSPEVTLHMTGEGAQTAQIRMEQYNDSADAPDVRTRRYRGNIASPAAVQSGDYLFRSNHEYYNGSALLVGGAFAFDNTNNAARTQFSVAVDTDGTGADPVGNSGQFKIDGNDGGAITFNNAYKFPTSDGSANQILATDGSGVLSFTGSPTFTGLTVDTNTLYVDSANNRIGIGTASPAYQVEIENTGNNALLVLDRTDGAACFIEGQATRSAFGSVGATPLALAYNSFAVVTIGANGAITVNPDGDGFTFPTTDGSANQFLQTDGAGNISFVDVSTTSIDNGTSNVSVISSGGNVTVGVAGNEIAEFASSSIIFTANVLPSANVTYNLGSDTARWNELFLAGSTLNLGTLQLKDNGGSFEVFQSDGTTPAQITGNIAGANVVGTVASATTATTAGTVTTAAQPNITSVGTLSSVTVSGNAIIGGDLTVSGNTVYTNVTTLSVQDPIIDLGRGANGAPLSSDDGKDRGTQLYYYSGSEKSAFVGYDNSEGKIVLAKDVSISSEVVTVSSYGNVLVGGLEATTVSVTGNVDAGNVNATSISGTLITAAQTNITSVGTLTSVTTSGNITATGNININDQKGLYLYDSDSSNYIAIVSPSTVSGNVTFTLPGDAGTADYVLATNGAGTLSWVEQSGGSSGASSFPNSTVTPLPSSEGNFDLSYDYEQTTQETPFETGGTDAFGVSLGEVYSMMDPAGDIPDATDLGVLT